MSINLHNLVRTSINAIHSDEPVYIYHSAGQSNIKGELIPAYYSPIEAMAQIQSEAPETLAQAAQISDTESARRFYLESKDKTPAGIVRFWARGGDLIKRADGSYWLITALIEDFRAAGWVSVRAVLQVEGEDYAPNIVIADDDTNNTETEGAENEFSNTDNAADTAQQR